MLEFQRKHEIGLSDIARTGLIIDLVIMYNRIQTNELIDMTEEELENLQLDTEWYYALDLASMLEGVLDIKLPKSEVGYLSIHLLSANLANDKLPDTFNEIREQVDKDLLEHILTWIDKLDRKFNTNLKKDIDFISGLALHIKPLLQRVELKMSLLNPWVKNLKEEHQKAYEMAIRLAQYIQNEFDIKITENEVAYLAMHIGGGLEKEETVELIETIIICASGIGTSNFLKSRLKKLYPQLKVIDILSFYGKEIEKIDSELIISTIPIESANKNIVQVSPLLTEEDQKKIETYLTGAHSNGIDTFFNEKLFTTQYVAENKVDIIKHSSKLLFSHGYVDENYYVSVLEREAMCVK